MSGLFVLNARLLYPALSSLRSSICEYKSYMTLCELEIHN